MKKIYTLVSAIALAGFMNAQTTIDFESLTLSGAESFDNGSAQLGDWEIGGTTLANVYDTAWGGSWTGFSISNMTDVTTPGWGNQYSAFAGSGYAGSAQYAVYYNFGAINTNDAQVKIDSFKITNSTYTALSMRYGDWFGKVFGSPNGADGLPDGTNGEDYLKVSVIGENYDGTQLDTIDVFLADYRFVDSTQDYILDTWENVDLTAFAFPVSKLDFAFESTDTIGSGGYWTPLYFSMDNLVTSTVNGIEEIVSGEISAYPNPMTDVLTIDGGNGLVTITDMSGKVIVRQLHSEHSTIDVSGLSRGVFIATVVTEDGKFTQKLIK
ncbi:MAG: hypothetical protein ACI865_001449 [Flavobacteriaceae bacterium]|jgi:hypothetical protein